MPLIIVRHGAATAFFERRTGLSAVQCVQDHHILGRMQIKPSHIMQLIFETGIIAHLEGYDQMGF